MEVDWEGKEQRGMVKQTKQTQKDGLLQTDLRERIKLDREMWSRDIMKMVEVDAKNWQRGLDQSHTERITVAQPEIPKSPTWSRLLQDTERQILPPLGRESQPVGLQIQGQKADDGSTGFM